MPPLSCLSNICSYRLRAVQLRLDAADRLVELVEERRGPVPAEEAARKLFVSEATIKTHLLHIYDKLGVRDRAAAVGEAYKRGLLS